VGSGQAPARPACTQTRARPGKPTPARVSFYDTSTQGWHFTSYVIKAAKTNCPERGRQRSARLRSPLSPRRAGRTRCCSAAASPYFLCSSFTSWPWAFVRFSNPCLKGVI